MVAGTEAERDNGQDSNGRPLVGTYVSFGGVMEVFNGNGRLEADSLLAEKTEAGTLVGYYWKSRFFTPDKLMEFVWGECAVGYKVRLRLNDVSVSRNIEERFQAQAYPDGFIVLGNGNPAARSSPISA